MASYSFLSEDPSKGVSTHSSHRRSATISSWSNETFRGLPSNAILCVPVRLSQSSTRPRRPSISTAGPRDTSGPPSSAHAPVQSTSRHGHDSAQSSPIKTSSPTEYSVPPMPNSEPVPQVKSKRSFGHLRSFSLSTSSTKPSQPVPKPRTRKTSTPQSRYAHLTGSAAGLSLTQEVQLSQMLDGGSFEKNVLRVSERHAHDTGFDQVGGGVPGVYRDGRGGLYLDEDEQLELEELLPTENDPSMPPPKKTLGLLPRFRAKSAKEEQNRDWDDQFEPSSSRRDSDMSFCHRDSALDPSRLVRHRDSTMVSVGDIVPASSYETHRRRSSYAPGVLNAFAVPPVDASAHNSGHASRPRPQSKHRSTSLSVPPSEVPQPAMHSSLAPHHEKRRRPATPSSHSEVPIAHEGRRDFFASSFAPTPVPSSVASSSNEQQRNLKRKASRSKLIGLFKSRS